MRFHNRQDAGRRLGERLRGIDDDAVVLGLPRGGVVVAAEVAEALGAPLDVLVVRKLGHPRQPELGVGAIGEGGVVVLNEGLLRQTDVSDKALATVESIERRELQRRVDAYRGGEPGVSLEGRTAVVVDDGIATGSTVRAAIAVARAHGARSVVVAVPVAPPRAMAELGDLADEVVCLDTPANFMAIGEWYDDFRQTTDAEVVEALRQRSSPRPGE